MIDSKLLDTTILNFTLYKRPPQFKPHIQQWVDENLSGSVKFIPIKSPSVFTILGKESRMFTDLRYLMAAFNSDEDAILFKLTWL